LRRTVESDDARHGLDRQAIERIIGRPVPQAWPQAAMPVGTRLRVVFDSYGRGAWAKVFTGRVSAMAAPEPVPSAIAVAGELNYWVEFDEPQLDVSGDGPYRKAKVWSRYLEAI
jgi:hypothetical protein